MTALAGGWEPGVDLPAARRRRQVDPKADAALSSYVHPPWLEDGPTVPKVYSQVSCGACHRGTRPPLPVRDLSCAIQQNQSRVCNFGLVIDFRPWGADLSVAGLRARPSVGATFDPRHRTRSSPELLRGVPSPKTPLGGTHPAGPLRLGPVHIPHVGAGPGGAAATRIMLNDSRPGRTRTRRARDAGGRVARPARHLVDVGAERVVQGGRLRKERIRCPA